MKLMGSLLSLIPPGQSGVTRISLREGSTVLEAIQQFRIPVDRVKLVLVNHTGAELNQFLEEGDRVSLFPPEYPVFPDWKGAVLGKKDGWTGNK